MKHILFLGDIVGKLGRRAVSSRLGAYREKYSPDLVIVNGENAAGGIGIEPAQAEEIFAAGADVITTGNHVWKKRSIYNYLDENTHRILRPANYPAGGPGQGTLVIEQAGIRIGVANVIGRVFMNDQVDCPFQKVNELLSSSLKDCAVIFIDFHAEVTSEKTAFAYHVDGRASVLVGTHTHVQTADERILPKGTAFISDVGMCGPAESVIGVKPEDVITRFLSGMPARFDLAKGPSQINGIFATVDENSGKATNIERIREVIR